jgi:hypothetical protein
MMRLQPDPRFALDGLLLVLALATVGAVYSQVEVTPDHLARILLENSDCIEGLQKRLMCPVLRSFGEHHGLLLFGVANGCSRGYVSNNITTLGVALKGDRSLLDLAGGNCVCSISDWEHVSAESIQLQLSQLTLDQVQAELPKLLQSHGLPDHTSHEESLDGLSYWYFIARSEGRRPVHIRADRLGGLVRDLGQGSVLGRLRSGK